LDLGYVTISTDGRFEVGRRLRDDYENGLHYYAMHGQLHKSLHRDVLHALRGSFLPLKASRGAGGGQPREGAPAG